MRACINVIILLFSFYGYLFAGEGNKRDIPSILHGTFDKDIAPDVNYDILQSKKISRGFFTSDDITHRSSSFYINQSFNTPLRTPDYSGEPIYYSGLIEQSNGELLSCWVESGNIYTATSSDSGLSWSNAMEIVNEPNWINYDYLHKSIDGSINVFYTRSYYTGTRGIQRTYYLKSTDDGITWSNPESVTGDYYHSRYPVAVEQNDGTVQVYFSYSDTLSYNRDLYMVESNDGGVSWETEREIIDWESSLYLRSVSLDSTGTTWLFFSSMNSSGNDDIWFMKSADDGLNWTAPDTIAATELGEYQATSTVDKDGTMWLAYTQADTLQSPQLPPGVRSFQQLDLNIFLKRSDDGGVSWQNLGKFTNYTGRDGAPYLLMAYDIPHLVWSSDRYSPIRILSGYYSWFARIGETYDSNPPPAIHHTETSLDSDLQYAKLYVSDDSEVSDVLIYNKVDGEEQIDIQANDNGFFPDSLSGDNIWSAEIGPFSMGTNLNLRAIISDNSGNTLNTEFFNREIPLIQSAGNFSMQYGRNGIMGSYIGTSGLSNGHGAVWPLGSGNEYLYLGGLWLGAWVDGAPIVDIVTYGYSDWSFIPATNVVVDSKVSDLDISMVYNDANALNPIGVRVNHKSYSWQDQSIDDFVIIQYQFENEGLHGSLDSVFLAWWMDFDVTVDENYYNNLGGFNNERNMVYMYEAENDTTGYVGLALLHAPLGLHERKVYKNGSDPGQNWEYFQYISEGATSIETDPWDYRVMLSTGAYTLNEHDTITVTIGIVAGGSLADLYANADAMKIKFEEGLIGIHEKGFASLPKKFNLKYNYPNPFNPVTTILYTMPKSSEVLLTVYDMLGHEVARLVDSIQSAGKHQVTWDASNSASGIYFYRFQAGEFIETRKMVLLK